MSLLRAPIVNNSHILAGIYFILLKKTKSSYQVRQILARFYKLVALILR